MMKVSVSGMPDTAWKNFGGFPKLGVPLKGYIGVI